MGQFLKKVVAFCPMEKESLVTFFVRKNVSELFTIHLDFMEMDLLSQVFEFLRLLHLLLELKKKQQIFQLKSYT